MPVFLALAARAVSTVRAALAAWVVVRPGLLATWVVVRAALSAQPVLPLPLRPPGGALLAEPPLT